MSSMMGAGVNTSEMFEKLESMRAVVTEVNTQFKNPVSFFTLGLHSRWFKFSSFVNI